MKFIKNQESLDWLRDRLAEYQHIFECLAGASERTLKLLDEIEATKGPIKVEKLKAKVRENLRSFEWDFDGSFNDPYEDELELTQKLMREAFGEDGEDEMQIPDFAPPVT